MALTWTRVNQPAGNWTRVRSMGGKIFLAISSSALMRSTDGGVTWTTITAPGDQVDAAYGNGLAVMTCGNYVATSTDNGATWTKVVHNLGVYLSLICYDDVKKRFVATASSNRVAISSDGLNWTLYNLPSLQTLTGIAAGGGKIVICVDQYSVVFVSHDGGETWESKSNGSVANWKDVCYGNGVFILVAERDDGWMGYSYGDGNTFEYKTFPVMGQWRSVAYGAGRFIAINGGNFQYAESTDGLNWTIHDLPYNGVTYIYVAFGGGNFVLITAANGTNAFYAVANIAPTAPTTVTVPTAIEGGASINISWSASTDADGNLAGYVVERSVAGGAWTQIYRGALRTITDAITFGWTSVTYRVKAYDAYGTESAYTTSATRAVTNNNPPAISGADGNLGAFDESFTAQSYTVTDAQSDAVTVDEKVDGVTKRSYTASLGTTNSFSFTAAEWQRILNGAHTITITATDSKGAASVRTWTFTKAVNTLTFTIAPLPADAMPDRCVVQAVGGFPAGSTLKVEVSNNANDASPFWEDVSAKQGQKHFFANTAKTAAAWGFGLRVTLTRGTATGAVWLDYITINYR